MPDVTTVVIGAGHAGLAMSKRLRDRSIDHVVLERGQVGHAWRTERWDSLRLLTPNWQSRLPGLAYDGPDQDGYMTVPEIVGFIDAYAAAIEAPVHDNTTVTSVRRSDDGYVTESDQGAWRSPTVVLASGAFNKPIVPGLASALPEPIETFTPHDYRNPGQLREGGVLVVGASATGTQIADEIQATGRPVTVAVGEHVRAPRVYRGMDIQWWMDGAGVLDEGYEEVDDINRARNVPSPQLAGTADRISLDMNALTDRGVRLVGRLAAIRDGEAQFSGSLRNVCSLADLKMVRLLDRIDEWATEHGLDDETEASERFAPTRLPASLPLSLDLTSGEIATVIWATGFRPDYSWLDVDTLDRKGRLRHDGGVADSPGLYALGLPFLRRRKSSFIHGAADDTADLAAHLGSYLGSRVAAGS